MFKSIRSALKPSPRKLKEKPHEEKNMRLAPDRWSIVKESTIKSHYRHYPYSFADQLSVMEYREDSRTFELEDGFSQAVVLTCTPIATEGRDKEVLSDLQDSVVECWQKSFASRNPSPWIMQLFSYKEDGLHRYIDEVEQYIKPELRETKFTQEYLKMMRKHLKGINREEGIFTDRQVTNSVFRGQIRKCKIIIYRRCTSKEKQLKDFCPAEEVNDLTEMYESLLGSTGIEFKREEGEDFQKWLTDWLNPNPKLTGGDKEKLQDLIQYPKNKEERPYGYSIAENVVHSQPISDPENRCWWFDGVPHQYIRVNGLMRQPQTGQITGEVITGSGKSCRSSSLMDKLPNGSIFAQTIVMQSERDIDNHIQSLTGVDKSDTNEALEAGEAIDSLRTARLNGVSIHKSSMGIFIRANPKLEPSQYLSDLKRNRNKVNSLLLSANLTPQEVETDELQIEGYITHLPMNFVPQHDQYGVYLGLYYDQDLVNLSPLWGRERGTGNPGFINYNRGGEPLTFDMFGKDKVRSSHGVLIGPQGSGKSATLNAICAAVMAVHRPRLYIIEKGGSFRLMGDYFERYGLKVKRLKLTPGAKGVYLCPYADAHLIFDSKYQSDEQENQELNKDEELDIEIEEEEGDEAQRDPMGEMLSSTIIMVTGGNVEEAKHITQTHNALFEEAIRNAATISIKDDRQTITSDVCRELEKVIEIAKIDEIVRNQMRNYLVALESWTKGNRGKMFNSIGRTFDEDADVTIIDVSTFGGDKYEAELSVVYVALSTHLFNQGEKNQGTGRDDLLIQDESHLFSTKPLLAPFMAQAVKLMRKLGIKALYSTQNITDFSHGSEKILKIIEWWVLLNLEEVEIDEVSHYRSLSKAQKAMLLSCTKQKNCYTEGVVMGNRKVIGEMLLRFVPPSEFLSFAMTDPEEKAERMVIRNETGIRRDIDAARVIAERLDVARRIIAPEDANILNTILEEQRDEVKVA